MRKSRFCAAVLCVLAVSMPFSDGLTPFATAAEPVETASVTPNQVLPPQLTWEERMREALRRLREKMGDPSASIPVPLKNATLDLSLLFRLNGLPDGLSAHDLAEMTADATELRDCAKLDPAPPVGTDFVLVVLMHDVGIDLLRAIEMY